MKFIIIILTFLISTDTFSQIGVSFSMGSMGTVSKASSFSSPILISGDNCFKVTNSLSKFWPTLKGEFFTNCIVNLDYIKLSIKITPNPVVNYAYIKFLNMLQLDNKIKLGVYNNTGQLLITKEVGQDALLTGYKLDMTSLPSGYYFIQMASSSILQTFKIIKN